MKLFWWNTRPNLGDDLSWLLLSGMGYEVEWASPSDAEWVSIGSVLGWFDGFTGTVFGSGRGGDELPPHDLTHADVRALRGMKTRELVKGGDGCALGDPGLLVSDYLSPEPVVDLVVVPHYDDQRRMSALYTDATFVDVTGSAATALQTISRAKRIVSSSLHGIVLADAFGIPRKWDYFTDTLGKGFKFKDYASVMGDFAPGEWVTANPDRVESVRTELRECLW